jgi:multicomponent Na+:H+ antiporter subunit F
MTGAQFLDLAGDIALGVILLSLALTILRLVRGPAAADRALALDLLTSLGIGFIAIVAIATKHSAYLDVAIALGLVGFLSTVAFARMIERRGPPKDKRDD